MASDQSNGNGHAADTPGFAADEQALQKQLRVLETDILLARTMWMRQVGLAFDGKRDYFSVLGYDRILTARQFREMYARGGIAKRIVEAYPKATWRGGVELYDDEDPKKETPFEKAFKELDARLHVWSVLERADILAGLSTYSVLLIGAAGDFEQPLPKATNPNQLLYLTPFWGGGGPQSSMSYGTTMAEVDATIAEYEKDPQSPRFGEPLFYALKRTNLNLPTEARKVHWTRVIHIAEGCLDDNVFGIPTLENVFNLLHDLLKVTGGGAEAFWLRAHRILHANLDKDMQLSDANNTLEKLKEQLDAINHNLSSMARTRGVDLSTVGSDVANFGPSADAIITQIAGSKGIPKRILSGSEMGELASSQDAENWNAQVQDRRTSHAEPNIARRLFDRLIAYGYLPQPAAPYKIGWPVEEEMTQVEKVDIMVKLAQANTAFGEPLITEAEIRERSLGMEPLTAAQRKEIDDRKQEAVKRAQEAMIAQQPLPGEEDEELDEDGKPIKKQPLPFQRRAAQQQDDELVRVLAAAIECGNRDVVYAIVGLHAEHDQSTHGHGGGNAGGNAGGRSDQEIQDSAKDKPTGTVLLRSKYGTVEVSKEGDRTRFRGRRKNGEAVPSRGTVREAKEELRKPKNPDAFQSGYLSPDVTWKEIDA